MLQLGVTDMLLSHSLRAQSGHVARLTGLDVAVVPADEGVVGVAPGTVIIAVRVAAVALLRVDAQHGGVGGPSGTARQTSTSKDMVSISHTLHCTAHV